MMLSFSLHDVLLWLSALTVLGVAAMGVDKVSARLRGERLSERSLWLIALAGGFLGIILGALLFHHKTSKGSFWPPVVLTVVLWAAVGAILLSHAA
ncbi:MAG: DUF1294 domain-containing protein [Nitrososphaerota archaeon]|nr:DUF1294 domain-containing protein [Nitrososphaerota archaeon]